VPRDDQTGPLLTLDEAAAELRMPRDELSRMIKAGTIRAFRADGGHALRRRDVAGLAKIQQLLSRTKALPSTPPRPTEPSADVWQRFQRDGKVDLEAAGRGAAREPARAPGRAPDLGRTGMESIGDSVYSEALLGRSFTLDALVDALEEDPAQSDSYERATLEEVQAIAREISADGEPAEDPPEAAPRRVVADDAKPVTAPPRAPVPSAPALPRATAAAAPEAETLDGAGGGVAKAVFALVLVLGFALVLYVQLAGTPDDLALPEVVAFELRKGDIEQVVSARGVVKAVRALNATAGVRGQVETLEVKVGQALVKDQSVVARIKARDLEDELAAARTELESKQLARREAAVELDNATNLITKERRLIQDQVEQQVKQAEERLDRTQTRGSTAKKQVETIEDELARLRSLKPGSEPYVRIKKLETDLHYAKLELERADAERKDAEGELVAARNLLDPEHEASKQHHQSRLAPLGDNHHKAQLALARIDKEIETATARIAKATSRLTETVVRSPLSGIVEEVKVQAGDHVADGEVIAVISDRSALSVEAQVDETDVTRINPGNKARVTLEAVRDHTFEGEVLRIATHGKKREGSGISFFPTDVGLEAADAAGGELRPGLSALVEIQVESARSVMICPIEAVQKRKADAGGSDRSRTREVLWVIDAAAGKSVVRMVEVTTGMSDSRHVELSFAGRLRAGEKVVVGPYRVLERLRDGDGVVVVAGAGSR